MFQEALQKIRHFLMLVWRSIRQKPPIVMIIDGKPVYESDPRAQRILRRLRQGRKRGVPKKTKVL